jgi:transposase
MDDKKRKIKSRKLWIQAFEKFKSVSKAARYCGIPTSTLYRWLQRYKIYGEDGLKGNSQRPKNLAKLKVTDSIADLILKIRQEHGFGPKRISIHLARHFHIELSPPTIWRVLQKNASPLIKRYRKPANYIRYNRPIPGERVQVDVMKVGRSCYQFTAIDDCTRLRVLRLYPRKGPVAKSLNIAQAFKKRACLYE